MPRFESRVTYSTGAIGPLSVNDLRELNKVLVEWRENNQEQTDVVSLVNKAEQYFIHVIEEESTVRPN